MNKGLLKMILKVLPVLAVVAAILSAFYMIWAKDIGTKRGEILGKGAGIAVGSWNGITTGLEEGKNNGIEQGLSAEDTRTFVQNEIRTTGKLEVLYTDVTLHNLTTTGAEDDKKDASYEALEVISGDAVFSVDLEKTEFRYEGNKVFIILPPVEMDLNLDVSTSNILYEVQKRSIVGAGGGAQAVLNSYKQLEKKASESILNYEYLIEVAEKSAIKQVALLADAFSLEGLEYQVEFRK